MTKDKLSNVIVKYKKFIEVIRKDGIQSNVLDHVYDMIPKIQGFIEEGRIEKAYRWLGFMQGVMWTEGLFTIEELKKHNKGN